MNKDRIRYRWNKYSIGESIASGILLLLVLFIGCGAYNNFRFERSFHNALRNFGSNKLGLVEGPLKTAGAHVPGNPYYRFLKASLAVSKENLKEAEKLYIELGNEGGRIGTAGRLGRAIVLMRRYDRSDDPKFLKQSESLLSQLGNSRHFKQDVRIQLGNLYLRRYDRSGKKSHLKTASRQFASVNKKLNSNGTVMISSYYDYLSGGAAVDIEEGRYRSAETNYRRLQQIAPNRDFRTHRAFAMARFYAQPNRPEKAMTEEQVTAWKELANELHRDGRLDRLDNQKKAVTGAHQLGVSLLASCYRTHGLASYCKDVNRKLKDMIDQVQQGPYSAYLMVNAVPLLQKQKEKIIQSFRKNKKLSRKKYKQARKIKKALESLTEQDLPPRTDRYVRSNLGLMYYLIGMGYKGDVLENARSTLLTLKKKYKEKTYPVIDRNLCLAFYGRTSDVSQDLNKARTYGEQYLQQKPDDSVFKKWFRNKVQNP